MKKTISLLLALALGLSSVSLAIEDTWTRKADMPTERCTFSMSVVDGRIYAVGGAKGRTDALRSVPLQIVEEYQPATDTWTRKADMPTARNALSVSVVNRRIYAIGGAEGISAPLQTVEEYHPATDTWTKKADMPTARYALSTSAVNGKIYAIGGSKGSFRALSTVEEYDPVTDIWIKKADMPTARIHLSTSVVDGKIYAIGGATGAPGYASLLTVEEYDPTTDTWTRKANMPAAGCTLSTSVVDGKIYAIGGSTPAFAPLSTVKEYDPFTDTWKKKADMPTARSGLSTSSVNGKIYAIGGLANPTAKALSTVEEYDTGFVVTPPPPDYNIGPVADAGLPRYAVQDPVVLDGTGSYDPDDSGTLNYTWRQISGPSVEISEADTSSPTISGFVQTDEIQECEFELVVSDGELTSLPDSVRVVIVPDFEANVLTLQNDSFDPKKPTMVFFGGGDCITGTGSVGHVSWIERANVISFPHYEPDPNYLPGIVDSPRTYYRCGDMIIAYLSSVAADYQQPIQTFGWSTGGQPAIDVGIHLNLTYADVRYAVNRVTLIDARSCREYSDSIRQFLGSSVDGEQCWIDIYRGNTVGQNTSYPSFYPNVLRVGSSLSHMGVVMWYANSLTDSDMNQFNHGVVGGAYWSILGPGKNLQLASTPVVATYSFTWYGGESSGYMDFYDEPNHPSRLPEPVTLIGPPDGAVVNANGVVLSCEVSENAIGYQLLFGSEPYRVMDYMIVSDTPLPPSEVVTSFPYEQTWWTIQVYDAFGSMIYADPVCVYPEKVEAPEPRSVSEYSVLEYVSPYY